MKPDYLSMFRRSAVNEAQLRGAIDSTDGGSCPLALITAYNQTVERVLDLQIYLNDNGGDEEEDEAGSSSFTALLDGEASEEDYQRAMSENELKPDVVVPKHRWLDKL